MYLLFDWEKPKDNLKNKVQDIFLNNILINISENLENLNEKKSIHFNFPFRR